MLENSKHSSWDSDPARSSQERVLQQVPLAMYEIGVCFSLWNLSIGWLSGANEIPWALLQ